MRRGSPRPGPSPESGLCPVTPGNRWERAARHSHPHHGRQARPAPLGPKRCENFCTRSARTNLSSAGPARRFYGPGWSKGSRRRHGLSGAWRPDGCVFSRSEASQEAWWADGASGVVGPDRPFIAAAVAVPGNGEATGGGGVPEVLPGSRRASATVSGTGRNRCCVPHRRRRSCRDREKGVREHDPGDVTRLADLMADVALGEVVIGSMSLPDPPDIELRQEVPDMDRQRSHRASAGPQDRGQLRHPQDTRDRAMWEADIRAGTKAPSCSSGPGQPKRSSTPSPASAVEPQDTKRRSGHDQVPPGPRVPSAACRQEDPGLRSAP